MTARELSGRGLADSITGDVTRRATTLTERCGWPPRLAVVSATDSEATAWYVRSLATASQRVGLACDVVALGPEADLARIVASLHELNRRGEVAGVILQTPLPDGVPYARAAAEIAPGKDVDGASPLSIGRLACAEPTYAAATADAVLRLLDHHGTQLKGAEVALVGRSLVVGMPLALLLMARGATVTSCDLNTRDIGQHTRPADIVIVAAGSPGLITPAHVGPDAIVIDVGTNPTPEGGLVGDVDPAVATVAAALSPVPGGVGPVTTAVLLEHVVAAAERGLA